MSGICPAIGVGRLTDDVTTASAEFRRHSSLSPIMYNSSNKKVQRFFKRFFGNIFSLKKQKKKLLKN